MLGVSEHTNHEKAVFPRNNHIIFRPLEKIPKVVVFDFDGTLAESEIEFQTKLGAVILYSYGYKDVSIDHFEYCVRKGDPLSVLPDIDRAKMESRFWTTFNSHARPAETLLPEITTALKKLKNLGCELAIFTARPMACSNNAFITTLASLGILDLFSIVEGNRCSDAVHGSDKTAQIDEISKVLNISPSDMAIVGDTQFDIRAGKRRNVGYTVAVRSGGYCCNWLEEGEPDAIVNSVSDFATLVESACRNLGCRSVRFS